MCNFLHKNFTKIKKSGVGWKIFRTNEIDSEKRGAFKADSGYVRSRDGWVRWKKDVMGDGFTFFLTKRGVDRCNKLVFDGRIGTSSHYFIQKIAYRKGLGSFMERQISVNGWFKIALCKEFKEIEEK